MKLLRVLPLTFLFIFILISLVEAAPPVSTVQQFSEGYVIKYPSDQILKQYQDYEFEAHVFNISNGVPIITGVTCYFHLYNASGKHHLELNDTTVSHLFDYSFAVTGANFSVIGDYYYIVQCNSSTLGGYVEVPFQVTADGLEGFNLQIIMLIIATIIFLIAIYLRNEYFSFISGAVYLACGLYIMLNGFGNISDVYTRIIAYVALGMGIFLVITGAMNAIDSTQGWFGRNDDDDASEDL